MNECHRKEVNVIVEVEIPLPVLTPAYSPNSSALYSEFVEDIKWLPAKS